MTDHDRESSGNESPDAGDDHRPERVTDSGGSGGAGAVPTVGQRTDVSLRGPAELADSLPYLLGFYPDDSIVVVALHGERGRFGARIRMGIPDTDEGWQALAPQLAECLDATAQARGPRPDGAIVFLCQEPAEGESAGKEVMERFRPLIQRLRVACGELEMPVYEALCLSDGCYFSYCCPDPNCCHPDGMPLAAPGTSAMAAAATYAGVRVHGSLREMEKRFTALGPPFADQQERILDAVGAALVQRMLTAEGRRQLCDDTMALAGNLLGRFHRSISAAATQTAADAHDDGLLGHDEAAAMILGLQDRRTRDRAAEWMEGVDVSPALRLWRALARRCVGRYDGHAAALLALAGWVAWSGGDVATARVALGKALRADPDYLFAQLLHQACNEGLDPELLRRCMREERRLREAADSDDEPDPSWDTAP
ncbi:DUF4192 domain-containing protein [Streptomyces iconiensis]|uniref:DUF4192 domain-containing protein n=1 Tax=Streptomyces iconiensis TaxID=1384038 RepID=A0ABT6ZPA3_9ACTN|nr:DUF4192 domain-containing protein [Streptomyces iconiensis]MDJ1130875.1 DUF4192 domain-containing protein [Streptomyces iconiensis]